MKSNNLTPEIITAELKRLKIPRKALAAEMGISVTGFYKKLHEYNTRFTKCELYFIADFIDEEDAKKRRKRL